jgi:hypothetical protein
MREEKGMETKTEKPTAGYGGLIVSLAVAVAFLGANPFADAVGIPSEDRNHSPMPLMMRVVCGSVVFYATFSVLRFLVDHVRAVVRGLGASAARPDRRFAQASFACGIICILATLFVQVYAASRPASAKMAPTMTFNGGSSGGSFNMEAHSGDSLALNLVSGLTFLAGAGLLAFGLWGGLKPTPTVSGHVAKPEGWGEATIDAARV